MRDDDEEEIVPIEDLILSRDNVSKRCLECKKGWLAKADIAKCPVCGGQLKAAEIIPLRD